MSERTLASVIVDLRCLMFLMQISKVCKIYFRLSPVFATKQGWVNIHGVR